MLHAQADDAPLIVSKAAVLMDSSTGTLLFYKNPDEEIPPASLTKLMTMHLVLREAEAGRLSLSKKISPPRQSWARNQPSRSSLMHLAEGQELTINDLMLGLAVPSGNDAAVAVALQLAPSVDSFVAMMNEAASKLGLEKTHFVEPSGISEYNMTTAREFASFCRFYVETYPQALKNYHSVETFSYPRAENVAEIFRENPGTITQSNHNSLLVGGRDTNNRFVEKFEGVDGLKTGYIDESGPNIALTALRDGTRFIAVILGAPAEWRGDRIRDEDGRRLLAWAFNHYKTVRPQLPELEQARVWKGKTNFAGLAPSLPLDFTSLKERANRLYWKTELIDPLIAPLPSGSPAGELILSDDQGELRRIPLLTTEDIEKGNFFKRLWDSIRLFFRKK
ncbi:D-alanyl-D-alanine carboxypeptidase family protein [Leadbettera azotonutricia]|nr:D-alanyl-D-alanine carboxypeptidase family protein [Leadbettera azotonutricia]